MKHVAKALVLARIKENSKQKPHTWSAPHRGPWDRKKPHKAEGGPVTDPDILAKLNEPQPVSDPKILAQLNGEKDNSWSSYVPKAISDIPTEIGNAASENIDAIKKGLLPNGQGDQGQIEHLMNTGKAIAAVPGLIASPLTGAARSLIGHPMADAEHAVGTVINPEVAAHDDPAKMYETAKGDTDLAMSALAANKGAPPISATPKPIRAIEGPSTKELFDAADKNYSNARGYGVEIQKQPVHDLADSIFTELHSEGYRDYLAPKTYRAVDELKNTAGQNVEIADVEGVRRALNKAAADPAERDSARRAIGAIDKYVSTLDPNDVAVNPHFTQKVAEEAQNARANYAAAKRSEAIDAVEKKAERQTNSAGSGTNIDNATRQKIKEVLNNPKKLRGFSKDEVGLMEKIVQGGPVSNVARLLGKFAPSGVVSGALSAGAGFAAHGPMGAVALPAAGYAAKKFADAATLRALAQLKNHVRLRSPLGRQAQINAAAQSALAPQSQPLLLPGAANVAGQIQSPLSRLYIPSLQGPVPAGADNEQQ